jgi:2-oxoglutarate ferredoxin oxidoreductase subunit gamma
VGLVSPNPDDKVLSIPATQLAEELGRRIVANVVMLGFFTAVTELVSCEAMEKALEDTLPSKVIPLNLKAFTTGFEHYIGERKSQEQTA